MRYQWIAAQFLGLSRAVLQGWGEMTSTEADRCWVTSNLMEWLLPVFLHAYLDILWEHMCRFRLLYEDLISSVSK